MSVKNTFLLVVASLLLALLSAGLACAETTVALGKPVQGYGALNGAALSTLTDGVFVPTGQQWQTGTIWWSGTSPYLVVDLEAAYAVDGLKLQADNNDRYRIEGRLGDDPWTTLWEVPTYGSWGMFTRPNTDNVTWYEIPVVTVSQFRISAIAGDNSYSVSEFQARGVPEPSALFALGMGFAALIAFRRR
jgi:hypothetical protein